MSVVKNAFSVGNINFLHGRLGKNLNLLSLFCPKTISLIGFQEAE